jgi:hypothetical protein
MAEDKSEDKVSNRIYITLPEGARALFDQLVAQKIYGGDGGSVARHLIIQKIDDLIEKGRLKP